jgi:signal transduction histidine kinase
LLSNAAKFTEGGTITLEVSREEVTDAASYSPEQAQAEQETHDDPEQAPSGVAGSSLIVFRVIDTGIGIAPDQISQLFHPFTQGDMAIKRMHGGTGLGLAICHRFCELMGGEITVGSAEGQGSTFTVRLPAKATQYQVASSAFSEINSAPPATATVPS